MLKRVLQIVAAVYIVPRSIKGQVIQIRWPKSSVEFNETDSYVPVECYTELTTEHLNKPIFINATNIRSTKPCLLRIPTRVEVIFALRSLHPLSTVRILAGNSRTYQPIATRKLTRKDDDDFLKPIYVSCDYATLSYKPYDPDDRLLFLMREARKELIDGEDRLKCADNRSVRPRRSIRRRHRRSRRRLDDGKADRWGRFRRHL